MKIIYKPKGAAAEYAKYAANFFIGCPNGCKYCYLKRGVLSGYLGGSTVKLRKNYNHYSQELFDFVNDIAENKEDLQKHGVFFSFTTDPMLEETYKVTMIAMELCGNYNIPVTILTKRADFLNDQDVLKSFVTHSWHLTIGTTLTGHDELEPYASPNSERIKMLKILHENGIRTFASVEPVIDFESSCSVMMQSLLYCDEYRIGLKTPVKRTSYPKEDMETFLRNVLSYFKDKKLVFKHSFRTLANFYGLNTNLNYDDDETKKRKK